MTEAKDDTNALRDAAGWLLEMDALVAEAQALEADEVDRSEMLAMAGLMGSLRAEG